MGRLCEKDCIDDPRSKAKLVPLTAEDIMIAKEAFHRRFA
jgi:hypothetical protein